MWPCRFPSEGVHHVKHTSSRRLLGALSGASLSLAIAMPASAHVGIIDGAAVHGGGHGSVITLRVGHGCDGAATDTVEVLIPEGVTSVRPEWVPGWTIETEPRVAAEPSAAAESLSAGHGAGEEVGVVRWSGGPVLDSQYADLRLMAVFPETPGTLWFPIVQRCGDLESAWIQVPAEGQSVDDLDHPAASVTVVEGEADEH